jgi:predicted TPR repeat methyltransferase
MKNNKQHWDKVGCKYNNNWVNFAKTKLSEKETGFILKHFSKAQKNSVLDIGSGNGRIIQSYLEQDRNTNILGLDISDSMVEVCRDKFKNYPNVKIEKCDTSKESIPYENKFDFVSAIRVLKYNENWRDIIKKISQRMENNGIFVFTSMNNNCADRFAMYPIKVYKTDLKEINKILPDSGLEILEITTFTKVPDIFYNTIGRNPFLAKTLFGIEKILEIAFGKLFLGRKFFIACRKRN